MLSQLRMLMPDGMLERSPQWALAGLALGVLLWAVGGVFSRYITTLVAVAVGTSIGLRIPSWLGWQIDGMGTGVAGALLFGLSGYLLHRTWIAGWLAGILMLWSGTAVWMALGQGASLPMPQWHGNLRDSFAALWQSLPSSLNPRLPLACAAAFAASLLTSVFCPKFSKCVAYSLTGTTLSIAMGLIVVRNTQPPWLDAISPQIPAQLAALLGVVALGAGIQWWLLPESPVADRKPVVPPPNQRRSDEVLHPIRAAQIANA